MMPESQNSPLLDNGSLTHVSMAMRIHGDRLCTEYNFYVSGMNKDSTDTRKQQIFSMDTRNCVYELVYKSGSAEKIDSVVVQS
jgi:hypothetical protein